MDRAKGRAVAVLHDDLMVEILSRVPVKDLCRSTCVSKPWRDLITDPLNRKKLPQTLEGFFHGGADGHHSYGHFTSLSGSGECVPPVDPSFSFLTAKLPGVERMILLDSCNGLLLFGCTREDKFGYIVCNPATEELVTVPSSSASCPPPPPLEEGYYDANDGEERFAHTFLMFDPAVSLHFHLFHIWENRTMVKVETVHSYSSETRAWTDRSSKWKRGEKGGEWGLWGKAIIQFTYGRALVNGLLHFVVSRVRKHEFLIVAVDGKGKTCRIIGWHDKHASAEATFIGQSQGHLHCISMNKQSQRSRMHYFTWLSVWVLQDYDTQEWILKHNVSTSQLFGLLSCPIIDFDIVAMHPDHNSIILVQGSNQKLVLYDMDSKELCALRSLGEDCMFIFIPYVPCFMESPFLATKD
ncbi:F-box protein At2g23160-like [Miscanthus floridulus]|uniref:F-box protein At2g23160-like n=1 Tax=Miscanthus floridulus TaxID=154761 RepID=UPI00345A3A7D